MIDVKVTLDGIDDVKSMLNRLQTKNIPYAIQNALNNLAFQTMREGRAHIQANIDNPTKWPVNSWYVVRKATVKNRVTGNPKLEAVVGWSDYTGQKRYAPGQGTASSAEHYLSHLWRGGARKHKAFERQLQNRGLMPRGTYAVPGDAAAELGMINSYGNMKSGVIVAILSGLGAFDEVGYSANASVRQSKRMSANKSAKKHVYWAGKPGVNTPNGIWMLDEKFGRGRGRLRPIIIFVRAPNYKKQLDLAKIAKTVQDRDARREFEKAIEYELRNAK
jgi:hypothetical protein